MTRVRESFQKGNFRLFEGVGLQAQTALSGGLLFPVLAYPGFPAFSGSGIAACECECRDIGISNLLALIRILRQHSHEGSGERGTRHAIEDVSFYLLAILGG